MKKTTSNIMLVLIVSMIILYTAADFALQYFAQVEVSPTLTTSWYAFWTVEIVALAAIKTSKVKHEYKKEREPEEISVEEKRGVQAEVTLGEPTTPDIQNPDNSKYYSIDVEVLK